MTSLLRKTVQRSSSIPMITMDQWVSFFTYNDLQYPFSFQQTLSGKTEVADPNVSFEGFVLSAYKSNGVVFACMAARQRLFSEARFQFRQRISGRPGDLFGTRDLAVLEHPWPGGVTGDLLARAVQDIDLAGNCFILRRPDRLRRLRPDYVTIILGSMEDPDVQAGDPDAEVVGYMYHPGGRGNSGREPMFLLREDVAHFAPIPDPTASYRGMSWLLPVIREYTADSAMTVHKLKYFENGATPNMVVTLDPNIKKEAFKEWVSMFSDKHEGVLNAYKTLYLGAGASVHPVGSDFKQVDFAVTQAVGETRICSAAGVPPVLVGVTEGIRASTYSNYQEAKRYFADATLRPLWRNFASSVEHLLKVPANSELWYDDRDIPFLAQDFKDRAAIQAQEAQSIRTLIDAGFDAESVVSAVLSNDLSRLTHSGLFSVQLQPAGTLFEPTPKLAPSTLAPAKALPPGGNGSAPADGGASGNGKAAAVALDSLFGRD
jgi:Phage portal protein